MLFSSSISSFNGLLNTVRFVNIFYKRRITPLFVSEEAVVFNLALNGIFGHT